MTRSLVVAFVAMLACGATRTAGLAERPIDVHVIPRPAEARPEAGCAFFQRRALTIDARTDAGSREIVDERWRSLGIPPLRIAARSQDVVVRLHGGRPQSYRLSIERARVHIDAGDADGVFYAFTTLAQLGERGPHGGVRLPCLRIADAPALRWRILSDDVSRGPLPTMRYFRERIRTIAGFKMNGYSPYMEHVFADPRHPLPAPDDGITSDELRSLDAYARRFHVALIPEQQTFAHMHETLRWERYASLAELPHGYLLTPENAGGAAYARDLIVDELAAVPRPPFFHIGSDEPLDLGRGAAKTLVAERGRANVYAAHVRAMVAAIAAGGARPLVWDDAVQADPRIFALLPKSLVFINWHYGAEATFTPYIERILRAGFDQMVAPGADNWNEIYPNIDVALSNIDRFVGEGKSAQVLGLFQTVWHDDGETLYEATWYPLLFAGACAWQTAGCDRARYAGDFPRAFFGVDDRRFSDDIASLARARTLLQAAGDASSGDYLFWSDPFDAALQTRMQRVDVRALRLAAEFVIADRRVGAAPPLHPNAARVLDFAARRYDLLGRGSQIAEEARAYYDDARANAGRNAGVTERGLNVAKYFFWELRDGYLGLEPLARTTWEYESRPHHEASVLERYHVAAQRAIGRADAINRATREVYERTHTLPPFDEIVPASGHATSDRL